MTLFEAFMSDYRTQKKTYIFIKSLDVSEPHRVRIYNMAKLRGVKSVSAFKNRIVIMDKIDNRNIELFMDKKLIGLDRLFWVLSGFTIAQQIRYHDIIKRTQEKVELGEPIGVKTEQAKRYWSQNYLIGRNLSVEQMAAANMDYNPDNPYYDNI